MNMRIAGMLLALSACTIGGSNSVSPLSRGRPATDVPDRFEPSAQYARIAPADTVPGNGCTSPMTDPRDGTAIRMREAGSGIGDFQVPAGKYGVREGELLRVECNTGRPLGIVKR
jgi:hypothetical protein